MNKSNLKRYFQFMLIVLSAGSIYPLIYLKTNYQETILQVFNISLTQLNTIYSVLGFLFVIGYLPSGILSDKFSAKKLLVISLFGTAIGGFLFAQIPSYSNVILIFGVWGIFAVFTFWGAHMKIVKLLAREDEEGRFFGILDGGRGIIEAMLASAAVIVFSKVLGVTATAESTKSALISVIYMYSIVLVIVGILVFIFVENDKSSINVVKNKNYKVKKEKFSIKKFKPLFKNKYVYIMGGIIFMSYAVTWIIYYFGGFLQTNIGIDSLQVGKIMVFVLWMRPIGGILGGLVADKLGKGRILSVSLVITCVSLIFMAILPRDFGNFTFFALILVASLFVYVIRGTYWSLLGECKIDDNIVGAAIGFVSLIGYLPDILLPIFNSFLFNKFGEVSGYTAYFIASAVIGFIGLTLVFIFMKLTKKEFQNKKGMINNENSMLG